MVQFVSLIRELMPAWLSRRSLTSISQGRDAGQSPRHADSVWHTMVEKDIFGANTPDYTHIDDGDAVHNSQSERTPNAARKPGGDRTL